MKPHSLRRACAGIALAACASFPLIVIAQAHGGGHLPAPSHPDTHGGNAGSDHGHPHGNPPRGDGHGGRGDGRGWHGDGVRWWGFGLGLGLGWQVPYYDYPYPGTVYVYPEPPDVVEVAPPADATPVSPPPQQTQQSWYYCASAKAYYPYVKECPEAWQVVPAAPPGPAQ